MFTARRYACAEYVPAMCLSIDSVSPSVRLAQVVRLLPRGKIQLLSKKVCYKVFLCVKISSRKLVATSFIYLTVHRWTAGDVPIYLKCALKVTHPFRKRRFRQVWLNSDATVRASENFAMIANRNSTMRSPSSHKWTPCVTPESSKGGSNENFYIWRCLLFLHCR